MNDDPNLTFLDDLYDYRLPRDLARYSLGPSEFKPGQRIGWWYKEDEAFNAKEGFKHPREDPPYSGVVVPALDIDMRGSCLLFSPDDALVVMDTYPVEKCYCESTYIAYRRLIDDDDVAGVTLL